MLQINIPQKASQERNLIANRLEVKLLSTFDEIIIKRKNKAPSPMIPPSAPWIRPSI
jgi:hypothetical protein